MSDPLPTAQVKVEDRIAELLTDYGPLGGWNILARLPLDAALEDHETPALIVRTMAVSYLPGFEPNSQILCKPIMDLEAVVKEAGIKIPERCQEGLAHGCAALLADHSLGGMMQDFAERDLSPGDGDRRDAGAISLQFDGEYLVGQSDRFTIHGQAGQTF